MNMEQTAAEPLQREIGGVYYIVARSFKENTNEDAASKMARLIRNETLRLMGDKQLFIPNRTNGVNTEKLQISNES